MGSFQEWGLKDMWCGARKIHGGGMKRGRRQYQGRRMYISRCVRIVIWRIRGGLET